MKRIKVAACLLAIISLLLLTGCQTSADEVSEKLDSKGDVRAFKILDDLGNVLEVKHLDEISDAESVVDFYGYTVDISSYTDEYGDNVQSITWAKDGFSHCKLYVNGILKQKAIVNLAENKAYAEMLVEDDGSYVDEEIIEPDELPEGFEKGEPGGMRCKQVYVKKRKPH